MRMRRTAFIMALMTVFTVSLFAQNSRGRNYIKQNISEWGGCRNVAITDTGGDLALNGKNDLTAEDLRVDSPYNTYTNVGLTPGPISNPGLSSLKAALEPADTNYYYYVLDPTAGTHVFATTQEEHDANRAKFGG